jgi:hypothetical protein
VAPAKFVVLQPTRLPLQEFCSSHKWTSGAAPVLMAPDNCNASYAGTSVDKAHLRSWRLTQTPYNLQLRLQLHLRLRLLRLRQHGDGHLHAYTYSYAGGITDSDANSYSNRNSYTYSDCNGNGNSNADTHRDSAASPDSTTSPGSAPPLGCSSNKPSGSFPQKQQQLAISRHASNAWRLFPSCV